jgi:hypothetical protein
VADRTLITLPDGTTIQLRSTLVFQRENGSWKVVQHHNSVGVPNEELVKQTLPLAAGSGADNGCNQQTKGHLSTRA